MAEQVAGGSRQESTGANIIAAPLPLHSEVGEERKGGQGATATWKSSEEPRASASKITSELGSILNYLQRIMGS